MTPSVDSASAAAQSGKPAQAADLRSHAVREELVVSALWQEQVHHSRVTTLMLSADGQAIYSGCDAAAPKLVERVEPSIVAISSKDGHVFRSPDLQTPANIRCLLRGASDICLLCGTSDGRLACLELHEAKVSSCMAIPGTPAAVKADAVSQPLTATCSGPPTPPAVELVDVQQPEHAKQQQELSSAEVPEFIAESGYRGKREGYVFRDNGSRGQGYYRKDVLLRREASNNSCAAQASSTTGSSKQQPAAESVATVAGAADGSSLAKTPDEDEMHRGYLRRLAAAPAGMHCIIASADRSLLFTSSLGHADCSARVWRMEGGQEQLHPKLHRTLHGHSSGVRVLALSPCGSLLFTGSHDQTIRVWSTANWSCKKVLRGHGGGIRALTASPDGRLLYSAASDNTIRAWSLEHWVCLRTLHGRHADTTWPCCLALSPDGQLLASGSTGPFGGSSIKVFQTQSGGGREAGSCLASCSHLHEKGDVSALAFSPDGCTLYSGASDGSLAAWTMAWRAPQGAAARQGLRAGFL